jgi:hypothetical protein
MPDSQCSKTTICYTNYNVTKSTKGLPLVLNVKRLVDKCPLKERKVLFYCDIHIAHDFLMFTLVKLSLLICSPI